MGKRLPHPQGQLLLTEADSLQFRCVDLDLPSFS